MAFLLGVHGGRHCLHDARRNAEPATTWPTQDFPRLLGAKRKTCAPCLTHNFLNPGALVTRLPEHCAQACCLPPCDAGDPADVIASGPRLALDAFVTSIVVRTNMFSLICVA